MLSFFVGLLTCPLRGRLSAWFVDGQARSEWLHCFSLCAKKYELKLLTNFSLFAKFILSGLGALFDLFSPAHKVRKVGFAAKSH